MIADDRTVTHGLGTAVTDDAHEIRPAPRKLISELDRSREDLAAGRMLPVGPVLTAIHALASQRIKRFI